MKCEPKATAEEIDGETPPRLQVLAALIEIGGTVNPADIVRRTGIERQNVQYHLGRLVEDGLALRPGKGGYTAQPVFSQSIEDGVEIIQNLLSHITANSTLCQAASKTGVLGGCDTCDKNQRIVVLRNILRDYVDIQIFGNKIKWEETDQYS